MRPTTATISQPYGVFPQASGQPWIHLGDDYACYRGQDIVTIAAGRVLFAGPSELVPNQLADRIMLYRGSTASGRCVITEHDDNTTGWIQTFNHLEFYTVNTGDAIFRGQRVGGAGDSGNAFGVHLHHECIDPGAVTNQAPFGRYNPQIQIDYEDAQAALASIPSPERLADMTPEQYAELILRLERIEKTVNAIYRNTTGDQQVATAKLYAKVAREDAK